MTDALMQSNIPGYPVRRGKVRDVYDLGDKDGGRLLLVASDRISAFDVVMPTGIPEKGSVLTQVSNFWFERFKAEIPGFRHHLIETDVTKFPADLQPYASQLKGRAVICRKTKVLPI